MRLPTSASAAALVLAVAATGCRETGDQGDGTAGAANSGHVSGTIPPPTAPTDSQ